MGEACAAAEPHTKCPPGYARLALNLKRSPLSIPRPEVGLHSQTGHVGSVLFSGTSMEGSQRDEMGNDLDRPTNLEPS